MPKLKFAFQLGLSVLLSITILNCSEENTAVTPAPVIPVDSSDFRYPFTDGSSWNYTITTTASDIQPDSIRYYFEGVYPLVMSGTATILYDTMINSVVTKCFLDEFISNGITRSNRYYYINNDTALILYARRQLHPAQGILPLGLKRNNIENDLNEVFTNELVILGDTLHSTLKYPMIAGTEWSYTSYIYTVTKKYLGFENVTVPAGTVSCMKENLVHSIEPNWVLHNYFSKNGLMKSYTFYDDITHTTVTNPDGDGTVDLTGELVITSFNIISE